MLRFSEVLPRDAAVEPAFRIPLAHDQRRRSRLRVVLADGREVGLLLPRGTQLREGDLLRAENGQVASVGAAPEHVSLAQTDDAHLLTRAAYHLGNRHVPLQIQAGCVLYPHDHVLDGMCRELGLAVSQALLPFEPEAGGYAGEAPHSHASLRGLANPRKGSSQQGP